MPAADTSASDSRPGRLSAWLMAEIWAWSLALQASWNPQRMQNLGLMAALAPWVRHRRLPLPNVRRVCRRHYEYFNTNPYLAGFVVGGLLRLEEENERAGGRLNRQVAVFRGSVARALASLGDQLIWLGLQPALLLAACGLAWLGRPWLGLALVGAFALGQLWLRWRGLAVGYRLGLDIVDMLSKPGWHRAIRGCQRASMLLAGTLAGAYLVALAKSPAAGGAAVAWSLGAGAACGYLLHRRLPGELVFLLGLPLALILASL